MSNIAIKAENLSKAYQLGEIGTGTISRDLERWVARLRGKEDPFLRIGETNDRTSKGSSDIVWSLKDINFEIEQGDAVGIIGRNGAGKSTLLKILSKVTSPTTGKISGKGRIASLLEVGTGFHPELTGRENIYLNGAILGMRKREISKKFDEIVEFAGIERYIDTPVKRYSSGMYVRLAFAVAAHLESEILIVDEVLAVGDAEFQKKCLGKMGDVSKGEGRTVLFVSHNMGAIHELCTKGIVLKNGHLRFQGTSEQSITEYLKANIGDNRIQEGAHNGPLQKNVLFTEIVVNEISEGGNNIYPAEDISIRFNTKCLKAVEQFRFSLAVFKNGVRILTTHDSTMPYKLEEGLSERLITIPKYLLRPGNYTVSLGGHTAGPLNSSQEWIYVEDVISFTIIEKWDERNDFNSAGLVNIALQQSV